MASKIPKITILPILRSMISIPTNPLIYKMVYFEEMRKLYPFAIMNVMKKKQRKEKTNKKKTRKRRKIERSYNYV